MYTVFLTGTAGSGKSMLTSNLVRWFSDKGQNAISVNLDPGVVSLPYTPDVDIRETIDIETIMDNYQLGPNGALILAADMIATQLPRIQEEIDALNSDYTIIDTPGQIELFAYRASGPFTIKNLQCDSKALIFLFDSTLVSNSINFVSIALLAASIQLRMNIPQIPVLSKRDLSEPIWKQVMRWASDPHALEESIREAGGETEVLLTSRVLRDLVKLGIGYELIPHSNVTLEGMVELSATLTRIFESGEEVQD